MNRLILDQPRGSFLALHTEGTYLLHNLQQQNQQAIGILCKLSLLKENLHQANPAVRRRRVQKHINWLKHRLDETTRQIQAILARSGQITSELQSRQNIAQLEHEHRHMWLSYEQARHLQTLIPSSGYRDGYQALQLHLQSLMPLNYFVSNGIEDPYIQQQTPTFGPILALDFNPTLNTSLQYEPPSAHFVPFDILTPSLQFMVTPQQPWLVPGETQLQLQTRNPTWSTFTEERLPTSFHLLSAADVAGLDIHLPLSSPKPRTAQPTDPTNHDHLSNSSRDETSMLASVSILTHTDPEHTEARDTIPSTICMDEPSLPFHNFHTSSVLVTSQPVQPPSQRQNPLSINNDILKEYRENDGYFYRHARNYHSITTVGAVNARRSSLPALLQRSVLQAPRIEDEVANTTILGTGAGIEKGTENNMRPENDNHAEWRKTW